MDPYVKTTWKKGMIISSDGLNNMENQIETLTDSFSDVEQAVTDVQTVAENAQTAATAAQVAASQAQSAVSPENLSATIITTIKEETSSPTDIIDVYSGGEPGLVPAAPVSASTETNGETENSGEAEPAATSSKKYFLNSEGQWALVETDVQIDWSEVTVGQGINLDTIPTSTENSFLIASIGDTSTSTDPGSGESVTIATALRKDDNVYITKGTNAALHAPSFIGSTFSGGSFIGSTFSGNGSNLTNITVAASNITGKLTTGQLPDDLLTNIPIASASTVGGVKIDGNGLEIDNNGVLQVTASAALPQGTPGQFLVVNDNNQWEAMTIPYANSVGGF